MRLRDRHGAGGNGKGRPGPPIEKTSRRRQTAALNKTWPIGTRKRLRSAEGDRVVAGGLPPQRCACGAQGPFDAVGRHVEMHHGSDERGAHHVCDMRWPCVAWLIREIPMIGEQQIIAATRQASGSGPQPSVFNVVAVLCGVDGTRSRDRP